jgi:hypothetical protein
MGKRFATAGTRGWFMLGVLITASVIVLIHLGQPSQRRRAARSRRVLTLHGNRPMRHAEPRWTEPPHDWAQWVNELLAPAPPALTDDEVRARFNAARQRAWEGWLPPGAPTPKDPWPDD